jgi:hypothetical protein
MTVHVPFNEVCLPVGEGVLERDRCLKALPLFAGTVTPRVR